MTEDAERSFSPPYNVPWATFLNTTEKVCADLPNKVDRTYLASQSGSIQGYLLSAFRGFGLIDDDFFTGDVLRKMAADPEARPHLIGELLRDHYPLATKLGESNATMGQLEEAFSTMFPRVTGDSRIKAIRFFLAGAEYAGLPRSPLWKLRKSSPNNSRRVTPRRPRATHEAQHAPPSHFQGLGETRVVDFGDAGTVTISVNVKWLDLPVATMAELRKKVDELYGLGTTTVVPSVPSPNHQAALEAEP